MIKALGYSVPGETLLSYLKKDSFFLLSVEREIYLILFFIKALIPLGRPHCYHLI